MYKRASYFIITSPLYLWLVITLIQCKTLKRKHNNPSTTQTNQGGELKATNANQASDSSAGSEGLAGNNQQATDKKPIIPSDEMIVAATQEKYCDCLVAVLRQLKAGKSVDINQTDSHKIRKATPLHEAVIIGNSAIVALLLNHGADKNAQDGFLQKSPLEHAQQQLHFVNQQQKRLQETNINQNAYPAAYQNHVAEIQATENKQKAYHTIIQLLNANNP